MLKKMIALFLLFLIPIGMSDTIRNCIDTDTMNITKDKKLIVDGNTTTFQVVEEVYCPYGCENNNCKEASVLNMTMFSILFGGSLVMMLISAISGNDTFGLIGALIIMLLGVYLAVEGLVIDDILHKNTLIRMVGLALILIGLYTMYAFGASQFGKKGEDDELSE